jgi:hypothetical protein
VKLDDVLAGFFHFRQLAIFEQFVAQRLKHNVVPLDGVLTDLTQIR